MIADWPDARTVWAVVNGETELLNRMDLGDGEFWYAYDGHGFEVWQMFDVRVIVDRDGNVAPPPITDEMVSVLARELEIPRRGVWGALAAALEVKP